MNPRHVTSLALSRKLKEAGVPQTAYWFWDEKTHHDGFFLASCRVQQSAMQRFSAWTSGELGEMLPGKIGEALLEYQKWGFGWTLNYYDREKDFPGGEGEAYLFDDITDMSEAELRGKAILHLLTSGLLSVEEIKGGN
jgi:hypothetical protein